MSDKYGYIGIETLLNFCSNDKNHCVTPNDFMRMNRVKIDDRPHGEWKKIGTSVMCSICEHGWGKGHAPKDLKDYIFCPNCGANMKEGDEE